MNTLPIKLTIGIPAYEYPNGIQNILEDLSIDFPNFVDILISDDSESGDVESVVQKFAPYFSGRLKYSRNLPSLGAVRNWNKLRSEASGEFFWLLHHDEYLDVNTHLRQILHHLIIYDPKVLVLNINRTGAFKKFKVFFPTWIRSYLSKNFIGYLLRRNFIGPLSCVVAKKSFYLEFDENLQWFVDVDWYIRLRMICNHWSFPEYFIVNSSTERIDSITAVISSQLESIIEIESNYLRDKHPSISLWIQSNPLINGLKYLEDYFFKLTHRLYKFFMMR